MPDLAQVRENAARLTFVYAGATFEVLYRPVDVNEQTDAALKGIRGEGGEMDRLYAELERLVISWDVTNHGEPVPPVVEGFRTAGVGICGRLMNAILGDVGNPTLAPAHARASTTRSSNGSSTRASSAALPTTSA